MARKSNASRISDAVSFAKRWETPASRRARRTSPWTWAWRPAWPSASTSARATLQSTASTFRPSISRTGPSSSRVRAGIAFLDYCADANLKRATVTDARQCRLATMKFYGILLSFVTSLGDGSSAVPLAAEQWQHSDQPYSSDIESDIEQKRHHKKNTRSKNPG